MSYKISERYISEKEEILKMIKNFDQEGKIFGNQPRNTLKLFQLGDETVNIKSFKVPNLINKIAYKYFRKGKAKRSFEFAHELLKRGIKTPYPIAYYEEKGVLFGRSFYISRHLEGVFEFREMNFNSKFPNRYEILKQFTQFTYKLHEEGIEFLDHSPGNTLIYYNEELKTYEFYLVDLNRMKFHESMDYETRIKNFARLTPEKNMIYAISAEYAKLIGQPFEKVFNDMWQAVQDFFKKLERKKRLKKGLGL